MYNPLIEDYLQTNNAKVKFSNGQSHQIILVAPADQSISTNQTIITVSGHTSPGSVLVVLYETGEKSLVADDQGAFETTINLIASENEIQLKAFSPSGLVAEKTITVVVTSFEF